MPLLKSNSECFHSPISQIGSQLKRHIPERSEAISQLIILPPNFTTTSGKLMLQEPTPIPPSFPAISVHYILFCPEQIIGVCTLNRCSHILSHQHQARMSSFWRGCLSQVLPSILLHVLQVNQRFSSSYIAYLED